MSRVRIAPRIVFWKLKMLFVCDFERSDFFRRKKSGVSEFSDKWNWVSECRNEREQRVVNSRHSHKENSRKPCTLIRNVRSTTAHTHLIWNRIRGKFLCLKWCEQSHPTTTIFILPINLLIKFHDKHDCLLTRFL